MADDVTISGGTSIAADEVNGVKIQRVKVCSGSDGSYADVSDDDPLPVALASTPLPSGASSETTLLTVQSGISDLLTAFTADVTALPHQPLDATSDLTYAQVGRSTAGTSTIVAATASQTTRLHRYRFTVAGAVTVEIRDGASNSLCKHVMPSAGGYEGEFWERPYATTPTNSALTMVTSGAVAVDAEFWTVTSV